MIKIEITAAYGDAMPRLRTQVDEAMEAIGFRREGAASGVCTDLSATETHSRAGLFSGSVGGPRPVGKAEELGWGYGAQAGQPAPVQNAIELPAEAQAAKVETETPKAARRTRAAKDESKAAPAPAAEAPAISTGENRVGPQDPPEVQEQDAADEAAETAATRKADATLDDVRAALGDYVTKFGMPAAQEDGPKVLKMLFGDEVSKISAIPDGVANFAKAVDGVREMTAKNPFKREIVSG